ncbi:DUF4389 domain-containing protein [Actinoplanes bogorensis]|uniref:DUF4389 domain-containing protein n=1 Tax=Paractinoplanes bogorensis TaxID=1610840 RepID=A0ABS5YLA9_9ACTN|nr:DUF4389 domain-containing protein [Actinoplanes bogorensis]MBU2663831.1 DUF4389 domain-containing protein [Actinoplanes bogorensis]
MRNVNGSQHDRTGSAGGLPAVDQMLGARDVGRRSATYGYSWTGVGVIGLLVLIAAVMLAVTGRYPRGLFDVILGLNRWVLRVAAYTALMTDAYPPFRLDIGGEEPVARPVAVQGSGQLGY